MVKNNITKDGKKIKKKLIGLGVTQKEFCRTYNIDETLFSKILYTNKYPRAKERINNILGIGA